MAKKTKKTQDRKRLSSEPHEKATARTVARALLKRAAKKKDGDKIEVTVNQARRLAHYTLKN